MHIRILTYNVHKCVGGVDRRYDPSRVAQTIAHYTPDIVMLQEVVSPLGGSRHEKQIDVLGDLLKYRHRVYIPHVARRIGGQYGNGILSRHPIVKFNHIDLSVPLKKKRGAIHAHIRLRTPAGAFRTLNVYNLHLGLSGIERKAQLRRFLTSQPFAHLHARAPIVVGGDFNDVWGTLGKKILVPAGFRGTPKRLRTFPAFAPVRALDALYIRGDIKMEGIQRGQIKTARRASDHLPLIADLKLI